jgi:hypothetical protein
MLLAPALTTVCRREDAAEVAQRPTTISVEKHDALEIGKAELLRSPGLAAIGGGDDMRRAVVGDRPAV